MRSQMRREKAVDSDKEFFRELNELSYRDLVTEQFGAWDDDLQSTNFDIKWKDQAYEKLYERNVLIGGIWSVRHPDHIQIREIQIHPDHRGRGLGTVVLRQEMERASEGKIPVRLRVLIKNRARRLYKRLGFVETGHDETHYYMVYTPDVVSNQ